VLKRIIWICIGIVIIAWIAQSKIENDRVKEEKRVESQRILNEIKSNVSALKKETGTNLNWVETLSGGEKYRFKPIMSIELEKEWIAGSPILFLGSLNDIETFDQSHYLVTFERSLWGSLDTMFDTELRLSLKAEKEIIDKFMAANPRLLEDYGFNNGVAIAARIDAVESSQIADDEGVVTEIKTGKGVLLGLVFTGKARL